MSYENAVYTLPERITTSSSGHECLWQLCHAASQTYGKPFLVNAANLKFLDGNMCAIILGINHKLHIENGSCLKFQNLNIEIADLLNRNGLLAALDCSVTELSDYRNSTVAVKLFNPKTEFDSFGNYICSDLLKHRGLPTMIDAEIKFIELGFKETFSNVLEHANTDLNITVCGQYFPKLETLRFTLVDLGEGFLKPIYNFTKDDVEPITKPFEAICWGLIGNSTGYKPNGAMGGTGLKRLVSKCQKDSKFSLGIVTDDCIFVAKNGEYRGKMLGTKTIGTTFHFIVSRI